MNLSLSAVGLSPFVSRLSFFARNGPVPLIISSPSSVLRETDLSLFPRHEMDLSPLIVLSRQWTCPLPMVRPLLIVCFLGTGVEDRPHLVSRGRGIKRKSKGTEPFRTGCLRQGRDVFQTVPLSRNAVRAGNEHRCRWKTSGRCQATTRSRSPGTRPLGRFLYGHPG
jgi:hypothetical protein